MSEDVVIYTIHYHKWTIFMEVVEALGGSAHTLTQIGGSGFPNMEVVCNFQNKSEADQAMVTWMFLNR